MGIRPSQGKLIFGQAQVPSVRPETVFTQVFLHKAGTWTVGDTTLTELGFVFHQFFIGNQCCLIKGGTSQWTWMLVR